MAKQNARRIALLDEIRGLDIWLMVIYHLLYTLGYLYNVAFARQAFSWLTPIAPFFAAQFIFISGIACHLSHNNWRRGAWLLAVSVGMTAVLYVMVPDNVIWFGILHFLAVSILLYALLRRLIDRIPVGLGVLICATLFVFTWWLPADKGSIFGIPGVCSVALPQAIVRQTWLFPLGLGRGYSADYFPLFPWIFCFMAGALVGRKKFPAWMSRSRLPVLASSGRNTLWIYLLHQPVIYGVCWLIFRFI